MGRGSQTTAADVLYGSTGARGQSTAPTQLSSYQIGLRRKQEESFALSFEGTLLFEGEEYSGGRLWAARVTELPKSWRQRRRNPRASAAFEIYKETEYCIGVTKEMEKRGIEKASWQLAAKQVEGVIRYYDGATYYSFTADEIEAVEFLVEEPGEWVFCKAKDMGTWMACYLDKDDNILGFNANPATASHG